MRNLVFIFFILSFFSHSTSLASEQKQAEGDEVQTTSSVKIKEPAEFQKVIDEYKEYVAKIPAHIREEVISYRKEIAKINKEKRLMYKKLSQESQDYLKKEQEYKSKLPLNKKALINVQTPGERVKN